MREVDPCTIDMTDLFQFYFILKKYDLKILFLVLWEIINIEVVLQSWNGLCRGPHWQ